MVWRACVWKEGGVCPPPAWTGHEAHCEGAELGGLADTQGGSRGGFGLLTGMQTHQPTRETLLSSGGNYRNLYPGQINGAK